MTCVSSSTGTSTSIVYIDIMSILMTLFIISSTTLNTCSWVAINNVFTWHCNNDVPISNFQYVKVVQMHCMLLLSYQFGMLVVLFVLIHNLVECMTCFLHINVAEVIVNVVIMIDHCIVLIFVKVEWIMMLVMIDIIKIIFII